MALPVVERQFQVVERQTQVAECRSGPFRLNLTAGLERSYDGRAGQEHFSFCFLSEYYDNLFCHLLVPPAFLFNSPYVSKNVITECCLTRHLKSFQTLDTNEHQML